ncbi:hypothetical protein CU098_004217, partial [Rhizopus stolonifer]
MSDVKNGIRTYEKDDYNPSPSTSVEDQNNFDQLRVNISTEKLKEINEDDEQKIDLLDILETVARNMIVD